MGTEADARPGALTIEPGTSSTNIVWYVTRLGALRVYRVEIPRGIRVRNAPWKSFLLHPDDFSPTGGLKRVRSSWDRRFVFVRTTVGLHRIDTTTSKVLFYENAGPSLVSDLTVDPSHKVYWASDGLIKRINANNSCDNAPCGAVNFDVWPVGGGVGSCAPGVSENDPCLSGISVHPKTPHLIYFSDNGTNQIGELDTRYDTTRRWDLSQLVDKYDPNDTAPQGPRQLNIEHDGTIWVVTGSGHLVSLDPKYNRLTKHRIPSQVATDPFGIAPDEGLIGYTDSEGADFLTDQKVAMLVPREVAFKVYPVNGNARRQTEPIMCNPFDGDSTVGQAQPIRRRVPVRITTKRDGTFVEALVDKNSDMTQMNSSRRPAGIAPDRERAVGAFFYAVSDPTSTIGAVKRIGHARLPREREKAKRDRDDEDIDDDEKPRGVDDDDDDDGMKNDYDVDDDDDGIMDIEDDDDDNDGIKNEHDTKNNKEEQYNHRSQLAASQWQEFEMPILPNALLLLVTAIADDPLTAVSIEVRNAAGQIVASSVAAPVTIAAPAAGTYIVKVKNNGATAADIGTTILARNLRLLP